MNPLDSTQMSLNDIREMLKDEAPKTPGVRAVVHVQIPDNASDAETGEFLDSLTNLVSGYQPDSKSWTPEITVHPDSCYISPFCSGIGSAVERKMAIITLNSLLGEMKAQGIREVNADAISAMIETLSDRHVYG